MQSEAPDLTKEELKKIRDFIISKLDEIIMKELESGKKPASLRYIEYVGCRIIDLGFHFNI